MSSNLKYIAIENKMNYNKNYFTIVLFLLYFWSKLFSKTKIWPNF